MHLHLMGHVHLTRQGRSLPVSSKAAALLTYLCLEGRAHHREHLAELLWDTPDPLRNLRVELARLKRDVVVSFPDRQPMLSFRCPLDLTDWLAAAPGLGETELTSWLGTLRGLPLSGLEDLGSRRFQQWLEAQRWNIGEQIERALSAAQRRSLAEGRPGAAGHIQVRADQLGLRLSLTQEAPAPSAAPEALTGGAQLQKMPQQVAAEWQVAWDEQAQLLDVLHCAETRPQLVLLYGRTGSGKRSLIRQSVQAAGLQSGGDTGGWKAISLQASAQRPLFLEALSRQLGLLLPGSGADQGGADQGRSGDPRATADDRLIGLASTLQHSGLRIVVAVQNAALGLGWLPDLVRFLLDLPLPLALVLCESLPAARQALSVGLAFVDPDHCLQLQMPPLSPRMVLQAWQGSVRHPENAASGQPAAGNADAGHAACDHDLTRAILLVQRSEGWPLHAQALYRQPGRGELPGPVRAALLAEVATLPAALRGALARLSLVHAPIGPEVAELLLGPEAPGLLLQGVQQGVLVQAAEIEEVLLPGLHYRSDDQTRPLQFGSEALRVALAGALTGIERQQLRSLLAEHALSSRPALSLHYAGKAGLPELVARARAALRLQPPLQAEAAQPWRSSGSEVARPPAGKTTLAARPAPTAVSGPGYTLHSTVPDTRFHFRREVRTANGYRVAFDSGRLEVLRAGWYGPAPLLVLPVGPVVAGPWTLTARLDAFRGTPELGQAGFAFGLRSGGGPPRVYLPERPERTDGPERRSDGSGPGGPERPDQETHFAGRVPLHTWFTLRGHAQAGPLDLCLRALDLALTVADFRCGGREVLPAHA